MNDSSAQAPVRKPLLTCAQCHFLVPSPDPRNTAGTICRRYPKQLSMVAVPLSSDQKSALRAEAKKVGGILVAQPVPEATIQIGQGNPAQPADEAACGEYRDAEGRGYWAVLHRLYVNTGG